MNSLPQQIEDIIINYKNQLEHSIKFKKCLSKINNIIHLIDENSSLIYNDDNNEDDRFYVSYIWDNDNHNLIKSYSDNDYGTEVDNMKVISGSLGFDEFYLLVWWQDDIEDNINSEISYIINILEKYQ